MLSLSQLLSTQSFLVLDGALATELERRGAVLNDALWSARLLLDRPDLIRQLHYDYLVAGADVITTASYQATFEGLARVGLSHAQAVALLRRSVALAREARDDFWSDAANRAGRIKPLVAASVGPYAAFLADGSEYGGDYGLSVDTLMDFHRERLHLLAESGADLLACETIPSLAEVDALCRLLDELPDAPAWLSVVCRDDQTLAHGAAFDAAVTRANPCANIVAIGVNCVAPRWVEALLHRATALTAKPLLAYPNSGERWDGAARCWRPDSGLTDFREPARRWRAAGARLIGGCCRTTPDDIRAMRKALDRWIVGMSGS
ncbi:MAG: homocysteine S-methyltransferase [Anaerolineales bacterium]|nr:homocysteine S-methyltransferase [Anaerolineales bacterium]MCB9128192.1 homocysteine S-methyltransferase [Ardenticatenales bacterium]